MQFTPSTGPIIASLLDIDFYKLTMGQVIFENYKDVEVTLRFKNRTKNVCLARTVSEKDLRRELDHVRRLTLSRDEAHYLSTIKRKDGVRMFSDEYIEFERTLKMPEYDLQYSKDDFDLSFTRPWAQVTKWEIYAMEIVNELHFRTMMTTLPPEEQEAVYRIGENRLKEKIRILREHPGIVFIDFGTRRRFSFAWQKHVDMLLASSLPKEQFIGVSNVLLAKQLGLRPVGTNAHEMQMVLGGLAASDKQLLQSPHQFLETWWERYGVELSIVLSDTFGSDYMFKTMSSDVAEKWMGFRHDSGDPFLFGEKTIQFYQKFGIDPRDKTIVFSDGLDIDMIVDLYRYFQGRIKMIFGWGTSLTNDMSFKTLSIVVKAVMANSKPLVKLSDNLEKATGPAHEIQRYTEVFDYICSLSAECVS